MVGTFLLARSSWFACAPPCEQIQQALRRNKHLIVVHEADAKHGGETLEALRADVPLRAGTPTRFERTI